jgi:hypothetical protein
LKTINQLRKTLDPKSMLHIYRDISLLGISALEVQTLLPRFPPKNIGALKDILAIAVKAIVTASGDLKAAK